ncbi:MAG: 16S rRNA (cytidine(1402)-2'-O)-methyltransferase [Deltaproteobacteria bacterium]|nr:16S rRNA (cytidine(1402)-2'-O)-methyltransferase [Deltaproteobacteria bacterium]
MTPTLYIVATPIGNLKDCSLRFKEVLESVDFVLAEDPRVTLKLLNHAGLKKKVYSYSEHSSPQKEEAVIKNLLAGMSYALISDAGTPAVSDPGARLVARAVTNGISVVPVCGPSAVMALISVFGVPETAFHFWGFFPKKNKKALQIIDHIEKIEGIHVFFESPYRILKTLKSHFVDKADYHMVVGREMTKQHETFYRGTPAEVLQVLSNDTVKGEFCVGVIKSKNGKNGQTDRRG